MKAELRAVLAELEVTRVEGVFVYVQVREAFDVAPRAVVREAEGLCAVIMREEAQLLGLDFSFEAAWLTLAVYSSLSLVGLTAAVATTLANEGIACNVIAGLHHDHLLVPVDRVDDALRCLHALKSRSADRYD